MRTYETERGGDWGELSSGKLLQLLGALEDTVFSANYYPSLPRWLWETP